MKNLLLATGICKQCCRKVILVYIDPNQIVIEHAVNQEVKCLLFGQHSCLSSHGSRPLVQQKSLPALQSVLSHWLHSQLRSTQSTSQSPSKSPASVA